MMLLKGSAYLTALVGIGLVLNGEFFDTGLLLLVESGVLFTLLEEPKRSD